MTLLEYDKCLLKIAALVARAQAVLGPAHHAHPVLERVVLVQVVHVGMMTDRREVVMTDQVPVVRSANGPTDRLRVDHAGTIIDQVRAARAGTMIDQVRAARAGTMIDHRVVVMIVQVLVVHFVNVPIGRPQVVRVAMMIDQVVVVMIVQVQVDRALVVRTVVATIVQAQVVRGGVMIDQVVVVMIAQVQVDRALVVRTVVEMIGRVAVVMIAVMFLRVHRRQRNVKPMKFITVPVVASTAKNRCLPLNTPLSAGKMMAQ